MMSYLFVLLIFPLLAGAWYEDRDHTCYDMSLQSLSGGRETQMLPLASEVASFQMKPGGMYATSYPCIKDESYGVDGIYVWVDNGCKAQFRVCYKLGENLLVLCSGIADEYHTCPLHENHKIFNIELINRLRFSKSCIKDKTFGYRGNYVWVKDGCRVALRVTVNLLRGETPSNIDEMH